MTEPLLNGCNIVMGWWAQCLTFCQSRAGVHSLAAKQEQCQQQQQQQPNSSYEKADEIRFPLSSSWANVLYCSRGVFPCSEASTGTEIGPSSPHTPTVLEPMPISTWASNCTVGKPRCNFSSKTTLFLSFWMNPPTTRGWRHTLDALSCHIWSTHLCCHILEIDWDQFHSYSSIPVQSFRTGTHP